MKPGILLFFFTVGLGVIFSGCTMTPLQVVESIDRNSSIDLTKPVTITAPLNGVESVRHIYGTIVYTNNEDDRQTGTYLNLRVYAYTKRNGIVVYSPSYATLADSLVASPDSAHYYRANFHWSPVVGADGYKVLFYDNANTPYYDAGIVLVDTFLVYGGVTWIRDLTILPAADAGTVLRTNGAIVANGLMINHYGAQVYPQYGLSPMDEAAGIFLGTGSTGQHSGACMEAHPNNFPEGGHAGSLNLSCGIGRLALMGIDQNHAEHVALLYNNDTKVLDIPGAGNADVRISLNSPPYGNAQNLKGIAHLKDTLERSGMNASIPPTNLDSTDISGMFEVGYYLACICANGSATVSVTIDWDNATKRSTSNSVSMSSTNNFVQGYLPIRNVQTSPSGIRYSTTLSGAMGKARYLLCLTVKRVY